MELNKALTLGNRWTKGNMDRVYMSADTMAKALDTEASNGVIVRKWFNRHERMNLKVFFDIKTEEIVVTTGDNEAKRELIAIIEAL